MKYEGNKIEKNLNSNKQFNFVRTGKSNVVGSPR